MPILKGFRSHSQATFYFHNYLCSLKGIVHRKMKIFTPSCHSKPVLYVRLLEEYIIALFFKIMRRTGAVKLLNDKKSSIKRSIWLVPYILSLLKPYSFVWEMDWKESSHKFLKELADSWPVISLESDLFKLISRLSLQIQSEWLNHDSLSVFPSSTLLKIKVFHNAIEKPFCLNGSIKNL